MVEQELMRGVISLGHTTRRVLDERPEEVEEYSCDHIRSFTLSNNVLSDTSVAISHITGYSA
jgi:hypothetical protein